MTDQNRQPPTIPMLLIALILGILAAVVLWPADYL